MKTRTLTFKIDVPASEQELLRDLQDLHGDPRLETAERGLESAKAKLEAAKTELQRTDREVQRLRTAVSTGADPQASLEAAIVAQRRAALLIAPTERPVADAERTLAAAVDGAR